MRDERAWTWSDSLIGDDRDVSGSAARLLDGTSLLIAGPRGSGRSHLVRAIAAELRVRGVSPAVVRPSAVLGDVPLAALDSTGDPRLAALRTGGPASDPAPVVVVDDAQLLDPASATTLARAVSGGRATLLVSVMVPRARARHAPAEDTGVGRTMMRLWLDGFADRVDLREMTTEDAERLLSVFPGSASLDAATTAGLIWRADGSRRLLRELVSEATQAASAGRDPLLAVREAAAHSRLAAALELHVADLADESRETLAFITRVPHISMVDASRFLPQDVMESLLASGLLHSDESPARRLTANEMLARESARQLGTARVDALVERAGARMLRESDEWWSTPLAVAVADRWHRGEHTALESDDLPAAVRARVALDAARHANDQGDVSRALAYVARGLRASETPDLHVERLFASAVLDGPAGAHLAGIDENTLEPATRRRLHRLRAVLSDRGFSTPLLASADGGEDGEVEDVLDRAGRHGEQLDWISAAADATHATRMHAATATRMRALLAAGMAETFLGRWTVAQTHFRAVERLLDARTRTTGLGTMDRLGAILVLLSSAQLAGADGSSAAQRLVSERIVAAREGDDMALTVAGIAAAIADTNLGRPARALLELETALGRGPRTLSGPDLALAELGVVEALASAGRVEDARLVFDRVESGRTPQLQHARASVEATLLTAEGLDDEAAVRARDAAALSRKRDVPALRLRDLFTLLVLGEITDAERAELDLLTAETDLPLAGVARERVAAWEASPVVRDPRDELRLHPHWVPTDATMPGSALGRLSPFPAPAPAAAPPGDLDLTRREWEIARLVDQGLNNREIAERLFLSVRTVESHVYQARLKVEAGSRADLGRIVARADAARGTRSTRSRM